MTDMWRCLLLTAEMEGILAGALEVAIVETRDEILVLALSGMDKSCYDISYEVPGQGMVIEASVTRCSNGLAVNYADPYMRRRDPDSLVVADSLPTDKTKYRDLYRQPFTPLRRDVFEWLKVQPLMVLPFWAGGEDLDLPALMICPQNAAFMAGALADLQGFIPASQVPDRFRPKVVVYVAPPFRHTHFEGKQIVVHNRLKGLHEIFSFNLYPGPSAKKGIYGALIHIGEQKGWLTLHGSTVKVVTPYDNNLVILHEGASGSGKSEMIEQMHLEPDGRIMVAQNTISGEKLFLRIGEICGLLPVTDDMALCQDTIQTGGRRLVVQNAEAGWFLRVNHITHYGTDPQHERLCVHPKEPLIFLNMKGVPDATCLIWEHIEDEPGKPCPNPRVILPRHHVPSVINEPVEVDVRSFGVRTPPCTSKYPTYGIISMMHILPPALAWLWRLVAPRGHNNPSITGTTGMTGEGVGSYWPFATGRMVDQANLLLTQIIKTPSTRYKLIPNQHIGAYSVGFMPQWLSREYLARRGSVRFKPDQIVLSRCPLLGYALESLKIDGNYIPKGLLQTNLQLEVGEEAYDKGAAMLTDFFAQELKQFRTSDLSLEGKRIIECFFDSGSAEDYERLI